MPSDIGIEAEEKALKDKTREAWQAFQKLPAPGLRGRQEFLNYMTQDLLGLEAATAKFYDNVRIEVADEQVRNRRRGLVAKVTGLFDRVADFRRLYS